MFRIAVCVLFYYTIYAQTPANNLSRGLSEDNERNTPAVEYVPLAPCACDLNEAMCDFGCCCDETCSNDIINNYFECPKAINKLFTCHVPTVVRRPPFDLFLCNLYSLTPYLGHFFKNSPILRTQIAYSEKVAAPSRRPLNDADRGYDTGMNDTLEILSKPSYSYGAAVSVSAGLDRGFLRLPKVTLDYACSSLSPVRFLVGQQSFCVRSVTNASCATDGNLRASSYLTNSGANGATGNQTTSSFVLRSEQKGIPISVTVNYLCRQRLNLTRNDISMNQAYLFSDNPSEQRSSETLSACQLGGGLVPNQMLDTTTGAPVCTNVVQAVQYQIFWSASSVINITATVILDNVQVSQASFVKQEFSVNWLHAYDLAENVSDPGLGSNPYPRSGNPGYDIGRPLISANAANLNGIGVISDENQAFTWAPDSNGLCQFAGRQRVNFGENVTSGCFVQLLKETFLDCDRLNSTVTAAMERLFSITYISKFGSIPSNSTDLENFVPVLRLGESMNDSAYDLLNAAIPDDNTIEVFLNSSIITVNRPQRFACAHIPTSVTLDIFYTESGVVNQISVLEVVGALLFYNYSTWRFSTKHPSQRFQVSSNVRFYKKPPKKEAFYLRRGRFHCPGPTCWNDLFFAFKPDNVGTDFSYALTAGLSAIIGLVVIYVVSNPWAV